MIVLVPEIALTPQIVARFQARFGDTVAVLHSALGDGRALRRVAAAAPRRGADRVGPRSAVFAPVADLGLVVVDEEHDASYKHEGDPRYDARLVAAERARRAGAALVAGSATPRPETWHALPRLRLPDRVDARALPPVERVDMRGARTPLHPLTRRALGAARKAIVLLNRRGWSNFLTCRSCGHVWECPHCDVALVLHRAERAIACHHCGHRERGAGPLRRRAARCPSRATARGPSGSRPSCAPRSTCRSSGSTPTRRRQGRRAGCWRASTRRRAGMLLGTQMVAKGHDFPDVDARRRARRRQHAALPRLPRRGAHVRARRAARGARRPRARGRPRARADDGARRAGDRGRRRATTPTGFLAGELERREALRYPPFVDLIRVIASRRRRRAGRAAAARAAEAVAAGTGDATAISGPRRCSACAAASAGRSSSRPRSARPRCARSPRRSSRGAATARSAGLVLGRRRSAVTSSRTGL